jgi:hypothetical protein
MLFLLRAQGVPAGQVICEDEIYMERLPARVAAFEDRTAANQTSKLKGRFGGQK